MAEYLGGKETDSIINLNYYLVPCVPLLISKAVIYIHIPNLVINETLNVIPVEEDVIWSADCKVPWGQFWIYNIGLYNLLQKYAFLNMENMDASSPT